MAARAPQKSIVLILARELASKLATPMFIVDRAGTLVYFNEPAEGVLGQTFAEAGELSRDEWGAQFRPVDAEGRELSVEQLPIGIALTQQRPAHRRFDITTMSGERRTIEVTAFPLFAREQEFVGAVAIFWEPVGEEEG